MPTPLTATLFVIYWYRACLPPPSENSYPDKIYFSRTRLHDARDFGELAIEHLFANQGYRIVYPETLSFLEQVRMVSCCKTFAATEGSISHNAIFLHQGQQCVVLKKANYTNGYQYMIEHITGADTKYININHSIHSRSPWEGPFYMCPTSDLYTFLGIKKKELCRWFSKVWYQYLMAWFRNTLIHTKAYNLAYKLKTKMFSWIRSSTLFPESASHLHVHSRRV